MTGKRLEAELADFYWSLDSTIDMLISLGNVTIEEIIILRNQQIVLDTILTNISKEWAKNKEQ